MAAKADWYTPRVGARTELGEALEAKGEVWLRERHLKLSDVRALVTSGRAAHQADREQQEQLAEQAAGRKGRSVNAAEVTEREDMLSATLPAVIDDLMEAGLVELARFLARLSFARYRIKVLSTPVDADAPADAEVESEVKKVERVERSDLATRADGLAALCAALRKPKREPIVAELTERGIDAAALEQLEADATTVAEQGRNTPRPVEATAREREAVLQQRRKWSAIRKLVQRAVKGDAELERLYRAC